MCAINAAAQWNDGRQMGRSVFPATSSMTHEFGIFDSRGGGRPGAAHTPIAPIKTRRPSTKQTVSARMEFVNVALPGTRKCSPPANHASDRMQREQFRRGRGPQKHTNSEMAVATPTIEPNVPVDLDVPRPNAVASSAARAGGFLCGVCGGGFFRRCCAQLVGVFGLSKYLSKEGPWCFPRLHQCVFKLRPGSDTLTSRWGQVSPGPVSRHSASLQKGKSAWTVGVGLAALLHMGHFVFHARILFLLCTLCSLALCGERP